MFAWASRVLDSANQVLRTDAKKVAVSEAQRPDDDAAVAGSQRLASIVSTAASDFPPDAMAFGGDEEMVMPHVPLGVRESGFAQPEGPVVDEFAQPGDIILDGDKLSALSWSVLDEGQDESDDFDPYGLIRSMDQETAAEGRALREARDAEFSASSSRRVETSTPAAVGPPVFQIPAAAPDEGLHAETIRTLSPIDDASSDLSDGHLFDSVPSGPTAEDIVPLPPQDAGEDAVWMDHETTVSTDFVEADGPLKADTPAAPSPMVAIDIIEPVMSEVMADDAPTAVTFDFPAAETPRQAIPSAVIPPPAVVEFDSSPVMAAPTAAPVPAPAAQTVESTSSAETAPPASQRKLRSDCVRLVAAYTMLRSKGGDASDFERLVAVFVTPEHEAFLPSVSGGAGLIEALEDHRNPPTVEAIPDSAEPEELSSEPSAGVSGADVAPPALAETSTEPARPLEKSGVVQDTLASKDEAQQNRVTPVALPLEPTSEPLSVIPTLPASSMIPVFELDDVIVRPIDDVEAVAPQAHAVEAGSLSADDSAGIATLQKWASVEALTELDVERVMVEAGRSMPDEMELEFLVRRLSEYQPSASSFRGLDSCLSGLLGRGPEQAYNEHDVSLVKGFVSLLSSHVYSRWRFGSREQMLVRLDFFFCDPFTRRLAARIEEWQQAGFETMAAVKQARALMDTLDLFFSAYPERENQRRELGGALDLADYNFSMSAGGPGVELVQEGLSAIAHKDATAVADLGRSRLMTVGLPHAVQDGLNRFMKMAGLIDEIDILVKRESIKHKSPIEKHPLHSSLMELEHRAVLIINDLKSNLVRRESVLEQLPSIIRARNKDLAFLYERLIAESETISDAVVDYRERATLAVNSVAEGERLRLQILERDSTIETLRGELSQRVVMDALDSSARIVSDREPKLTFLQKKGPVKLRAVLAPGDEVAVVFIHGLDSKWAVMSGSSLEMQGSDARMVVQKIDLLALRESIRMTHQFGTAKILRLRIVVDAGDLAGGRTDFVFTRQDVVVDPSRLLEPSDFDQI